MRAALPLPCVALLALSVATGCTEDEEVIDQGLVPTAVSVDPQRFLGDVQCGPTPGAMQSFVAVFKDEGPKVSDDPNQKAPGFPFTLPASPPTPCSEVASYRFVVIGHRYSAEVDGYEQPANKLVPSVFGCDPKGAAGSRHLCGTDESGALVPVTPRWTTSCGLAEDNTLAVAKNNTDVKVGCSDPLEDEGGTVGKTALLVDPNVALGALTCAGDEGGDVATLSIIPQGSALAELSNIPCGATPAPYEEDIEPGATYVFRIEARAPAEDPETEGPVVWGASCFSIPKEGVVNTATCDPLTDKGTLNVAFECPTGGDTFTVVDTAEGGAGVLGTFDCGDEARVLGLPAGDYELEVTVVDADGMEQPKVTCTAAVPPGGEVTAACPPR